MSLAVVEFGILETQKFEAAVRCRKDAALLGNRQPVVEPGKRSLGSREGRLVLGEGDAALLGGRPDEALGLLDGAGCGPYGLGELERGGQAADPPDAGDLGSAAAAERPG